MNAFRPLLLAAAAACVDVVATPEPQPYALVADDVWSGGDALLVSAGFASPAALPAVSLDGAPLAVRRLDDTTLAVDLPDLPGLHHLKVESPLVVSVETPIRLRGFVRVEPGPDIQGRTQVWPGPPAVLGQGASGLVLWRVSPSTRYAFPESLHASRCSWGVGPSFEPTRVVLHTTQCNNLNGWKSWDLTPPLTVADSLPWGSERFAAELAPGRSLYPTHHWFRLAACDTGACTVGEPIRAESVRDVVISPRGDRAVPLASTMPGGALVLDARAASVSYVIPELVNATSALFSQGGDTLYLAGTDTASAHVLLVLRAADGQRLGAVPLPTTSLALAFDPLRPWVYSPRLHVQGGSLSLVLEVRDRSTLAIIAAPAAPAGSFCFFCLDIVRVLPSPLEQRVYLANTLFAPYFYAPGQAAQLIVFDTPP